MNKILGVTAIILITAVAFNIIMFSINAEKTVWIPITNIRFTLGTLHKATWIGEPKATCSECQQSFQPTFVGSGSLWEDTKDGVARELILGDTTLVQYCFKVKVK